VIGDTMHSRIYLILEYCNDKDLDSYFTKLYAEKRIKKEEDVLVYFKEILNAFEDLYKLNIIHRDIKPENILVHNNVLKIGDFGLSKQIF
jgi:serine/threonine protein kinase